MMGGVREPRKGNELRDEVERFDDARRSAVDLRELYANPGIEPSAKLAITHQIAKRLDLSEMAVKVLEVLINNRRINDLAPIVEALAIMVTQPLGIVVAEVRT